MRQYSKQELSDIYHKNSNKKASKILGVCIPVMLRILKAQKIKMKGSGRKREDKFKIID